MDFRGTLKFIVFLSLILPAYGSIDHFLILPSIFSSNMVLQQKANVPIWGKARPGDEVSIQSSWGKSGKTIATADGSWMTRLKTPGAGGPFEVVVQSGTEKVVYHNVLIGEVWLCSGQSNMELPLEGQPPLISFTHSAEEIQDAHYPQIRFFTARREVSVKPEFNLTGEWKVCDSLTAAKFSATAYFFGKKLFKELNVPIGLISSSWGGTPAQAWTNEKYLRTIAEFDQDLNKLDLNREDIVRQMDWIKNHPTVDVSEKESTEKWQNLDFNDEECSRSDYDDGKWKVMDLPTLWEKTQVANFDGTVWFRKKIQIPDDWKNKELILELGPIDDVDRTYVNGELVGKTEEEEKWQQNRIYTVPADIVKDSYLTIAVRVIDYGGGGGLYGDTGKLRIHKTGDSTALLLAGEWKYLPVAEYFNSTFYIYGAKDEEYFRRPNTTMEISANVTPTLLYNAMIAPIIPYKIKGVIWYQGEENTRQPTLYRKLFPLLIQDWREEWKEKDLPFYFVQIAPYRYDEPVQSQFLREAQFLTMSTPHTGMAVTLDIGNPDDIHPADKLDVGERLARWALAKNYNINIPYSGPLYKSMKIKQGTIVLSFDYIGKGLVLKSDPSMGNFLIAGEDRRFVKADVRIMGERLVVSSPEVQNPVAVRYAWSNTAAATLFNMEGLPASSFRTDDWEN